MKLSLSLACAVAVLLAAACTNTAEEAKPHTFPKPTLKGTVSIEETLAARRSVRAYATRPLSDAHLGQLLWAAQGITAKGRGLRTAPSAGALYPIEIYVFLDDGVHHYSPANHALTLVKAGDQRPALARAALGQRCVRANGVVILIAAEYARTTRKYGDRAKMYVDIEAGCVCQNVLLQAVALDIAGVPVGAFRDAEVKTLGGLPEAETPILLIPVGYPREE
jgi:SagB-type dehydrogenase family enzyme